ncbi:MAG TPA: hypothetical protein VLY21_02925 [Nitrososphaerales archaeon]|nr:hypothetical protein [Nitrososphaerales archaeon]
MPKALRAGESSSKGTPLFVGGYTKSRMIGTTLGMVLVAALGLPFVLYAEGALMAVGFAIVALGIGGSLLVVFRTPRIAFYEDGFVAKHHNQGQNGSFSYQEINSIFIPQKSLLRALPSRPPIVKPRLVITLYPSQQALFESEEDNSFKVDNDPRNTLEIFNDPVNEQLGIHLSEWLTRKIGERRVRRTL